MKYKKNKENKNALKNLGLITQMGLSVITPIILCVYFGQFLDKRLGKEGIFTIVFLLLGTGAGFLNLLKIAGLFKK